MSDTTTMQTLDDAADNYGFVVPYNGTNDFYDREAIKHFKAGAEWQAKQQLPEIAQKEPVNFLLANALKLCTEDQLIALRDLLIERTPKQQVVIDEVELERLAVISNRKDWEHLFIGKYFIPRKPFPTDFERDLRKWKEGYRAALKQK